MKKLETVVDQKVKFDLVELFQWLNVVSKFRFGQKLLFKLLQTDIPLLQTDISLDKNLLMFFGRKK